MVIKEHKIFVALSEALYWKHAYFQLFDSTSIERAIAPHSDGSGSILYHSNIRSDIRQHWHYGIMAIMEHKIFVALSEAL